MSGLRQRGGILPTLAAAGLALGIAGCVAAPRGAAGLGAVGALQGSRVLLAPAGLLLASYDRDGDGAVSVQERAAGVSVSFASADADQSGALRIIEVDAWRERVLGDADRRPPASAFDVNFDGTVTEAEFGEALERLARELDADKDGVLSFAELAIDAALLGPGPGGPRPVSPIDVGVRPPRIPQ